VLASLAAAALVATSVVAALGPAGAASPLPSLVTPGTWNPLATPTTFPYAFTTYGGVSCVGPSFCVAVGYSQDTEIFPPPPAPNWTNQTAVGAFWNGTTWTGITNLPSVPPGTASALNAVSCVSESWCMAVGQVGSGPATPLTLVEQWNGATWSAVPSPNPGSMTNSLAGVSCSSTNYCVAVGQATGASGSTPLVVVWNGSYWSPAVLPALGSGTLSGVSCQGLNCQAVGEATPLTPSPLALGSNGPTWTFETTPAGAFNSQLNSVSCASSAFCVAVGVQNTNVKNDEFVEQWNGKAWSAADLGGTKGGALNGVNCFGPTSCVAVGYLTSSSGTVTSNRVYAFNGTNWTPQGLTLAPANTFDVLSAIDCIPNDACVAVGASGPPTSWLPEAFSASIVRPGYAEVASDGSLFTFGTPFFGSMGGKPLHGPVQGMAMTPDGGGYWEVSSDGGVFAFGDAGYYGSMGGQPLNAPIIGIAPTLDGLGYYEVATDGGIFAFGDAVYDGSMGGQHLNRPIVGIALAPDGLGYYEVAADGGLFAFGQAPFAGSMGGQHLNKPVVGMAVTPAGGYYEVASDGGLFAFGGAPFLGSMGGKPLNRPVVDMAVEPAGGYYEVATDGGLFAFGGAVYLGSKAGKQLSAPVVGMAQ